MNINKVQYTPISYKGLNLFGKLKTLVTKPEKDTFVRTTQEYVTPAVSKKSFVEEKSIDVADRKQQKTARTIEEEKNTTTIEQKTSIPTEKGENQKQLTPEEIEAIKIREREASFEEYFKEYFKKVHLGKSTDGYCKLLEQKLLERGVHVTFENDALTAKKVYKTITELQDRGITVPREIILMTPHDDDLLGFTPTTEKGYERYSPVFIKKGIQDYTDTLHSHLKEAGFRHSTDETARGTIIHEIGHYNHLPMMLDEKESIQIWKKHFPSFQDAFEFGKKVSAHAVPDETGCEFVAEVFTGLVNGETFDEEVMTLYEELKGPSVPQKK